MRNFGVRRFLFWIAAAAILIGASSCGSSASEVGAEQDAPGDSADEATVAADDSEPESPDEAGPDDTEADEPEPDDTESDEPEADEPTADELREIVLDGWDLIFDGDFESLIPWYTADCRERLVADDFAVTLGAGLEDLKAFGIDLDEVELDVRIEDFVAGESAGAVTIATLPGEEPSDDPAQGWVVEDGQWRNPDCEDIAGASSAGLADGAPGTADNPAALGSVFEFDDWRAGVTDVFDAVDAGLVPEYAGTPPEGMTWVAVIYESQYLGELIGESEPFVINAVGSSVFDTYSSDCSLGGEAFDEAGYVYSGEAVPGQTFIAANCIEVPTGELNDIVYVLEHAFSGFAPEVVFSPTGIEAPPLPPAEIPEFDVSVGALRFGEVHDFGEGWTATVLTVVDGVAEGLISDFSDAPSDGSTYPVVIYEATYDGPELTVSSPIQIDVIGSVLYDTFSSDCFLDADAVTTVYDTTDSYEYTSGETFRIASCVTTPIDEIDSLAIKMLSYENFDEPVIFVP